MCSYEVIDVLEVLMSVFLLRVIDHAALTEGETADGLTALFEERFVI
jgi:hypothetical protein